MEIYNLKYSWVLRRLDEMGKFMSFFYIYERSACSASEEQARSLLMCRDLWVK
jgi:hypothetical protein